MNVRECVKLAVLASLLAVFTGLGTLFRRSSPVDVYVRQCNCPPAQASNHLQAVGGFRNAPVSQGGRVRLLSYQPPGNGWNNQRIALENAIVLAKLLNRTLVVHPMSPHSLGNKLKAGRNPGYVAYNMINSSDLLPLTYFMDLELLSQLVPVISVNTSHRQFMEDYRYLKWKNVCHSTGFGYWVDQVPQTSEEVELLLRQKFTPANIWKEKCPEELQRAEVDPSPIVRYVSDLATDPAEMLYFEQGTLFGIHIRFTTYERAMEAQNWVVKYVRYSDKVWERAEKVRERMERRGRYNAIQVRRGDHHDRKLPQSFWLDRMAERNFSKDIPVYVATDATELSWFQPFTKAGFKLFFATNFSDILNFTLFSESVRGDYLGIHDQCLCEAAIDFIPSPASTFDAFILRHRGEVRTRDGLMVDTLHTYWIGHQATDRTAPVNL